MQRIARIERRTLETQIQVELNLDGSGDAHLDIPVPFLAHMLDQVARHGLLDLRIQAQGDTQIDDHHTVEDLGISIGQALAQAMGAFGASAVTIATVFQARQCVRVDPFAVSQAYGLTPAEARVAVGVAENKTIKTLARQYHVEISTLRTQLHCVFEKIGVQRQSELAQVLSSNPVLWGGGVLENGHA